MKTVNWPDFSAYGMALIMRRTAVGRPVFQLYRSSQHSEFSAAFADLGFQQTSSGEWVRLRGLEDMPLAVIQGHFPEVFIRETPMTLISPELAASAKARKAEVATQDDSQDDDAPASTPDATDNDEATAGDEVATPGDDAPQTATQDDDSGSPASDDGEAHDDSLDTPAVDSETAGDDTPAATETDAANESEDGTDGVDQSDDDPGALEADRSDERDEPAQDERAGGSPDESGAAAAGRPEPAQGADENGSSDDAGNAVSGTTGDRDPIARPSSGDRDAAVPDGRLNHQLADEIGDHQSGFPAARADGMLALGTLVDIERKGTAADDLTVEQIENLARFNGWSNVLASGRDTPSRVISGLPGGGEWLDDSLDYENRSRMNNSMLTSFYTPPSLVKAIWGAVRKMGFEGGKILDPAVGSGFFIGHSGDDGQRFKFHGTDIDPVASRIASALYPQAKIQNKRFEKFSAPDESFDLAVTNVPFDTFTVNDPRYSKKYSGLRIHDYFFVRSLDLVRPGGLVAFITSYGTMDKQDTSIRESLAEQANLVTAFRFPTSTFPGTAAGADLIILQKHSPTMTQDDGAWVETREVELPTRRLGPKSHHVNRYFLDNPDHVLGALRSEQMGPHHMSAVAMTENAEQRDELLASFAERLAEAIPADLYKTHSATQRTAKAESVEPPRFDISDARARHMPAGCFVLNDDGELCTLDVVSDSEDADQNTRTAVPANVSKTMAARLSLLVPVRDAALEVLEIQSRSDDDNRLHQSQATLKSAYERFTKRFGAINKRSNARSVLAEPYAALILSLEDYDEENDKATPTPIFTERTVGRAKMPDQAENADDALIISLNAFGRPNVAYMATLLGEDVTEAQVLQALGDKLYFDPESKDWTTSTKYLSGNIAQKLEFAKNAAEIDPEYARNVAALEHAMPEPLAPSQISIGLGSPWIPPQIYEQFIAKIAGCSFDESDVNARTPVEITYSAVMGSFTYDERPSFMGASNYGERESWSTQKCKFKKIVDAALNNRAIELTYEDDEGRRVPDRQATMEANTLVQKMRDRFESWAKEGAERSDYLTDLYNTTVNVWVEQKYDGSHLTFPGMAATESFRAHQKDFVWRVIVDGNALAAHCVGAGKTGAMIGAAMECKRLGLCRKPMFSVPKAVLLQFASQVNRFYPAANVLVVTNDDLHKDNRKRFFAKVATHNWDAVLITHDAFARVSMTPETQRKYIGEELAELRNAQDSMEDRASQKIIERRVQALEGRLEKLADAEKKDAGSVYFEHLGVDMLTVDEAHYFKNLSVSTSMARTPGVNTSASIRASDLHMKTRYMMAQNDGERGVVFATGTPISNSMVEMYNMSRYLAPSTLDAVSCQHFDGWAANFGRIQTQIERSPDGAGYRMHGRFSKFVNVPELVKLFRQVADVKMHKDLDLPVPKRVPMRHVVEPPIMLTAFMRSLAYRAKHAGDLDGRDNDNILAIATDGRHASLDMRTLSPDMPEIRAKLDDVVDNVVKYYHQETENLGVNMVFCDLSTPKKDRWSFYDACRERLIERGIPADEIAFIHDASNDAAKERMFEKVRQGKIRVFMGSTNKMGTGVDVQNRICDMHEVDPPWRPSDVEQRQGRGIRQGNMFSEVRSHYYVTRDSYDEFMFEALKRKADFIAQALTNPDMAQRQIEEQADPQFAEIMALSTGNPMIKEKVDLDTAIEEMQTESRIHSDRQHRARRDMRSMGEMISRFDDKIDRLGVDIENRLPAPESFVFTTIEPIKKGENTLEVSDRRLFGEYVLGKADFLDYRNRGKAELGTYAGMTFGIEGTVGLDGKPAIYLKRYGELATEVELTMNSAGVAAQVTNLAQNMQETYDTLNQRRSETQTNLDQLEAKGMSPYERAGELEAAITRVREVDAALTKASEEENGGQAYSPEITEALSKMMDMADRNGNSLVPREMLGQLQDSFDMSHGDDSLTIRLTAGDLEHEVEQPIVMQDRGEMKM